MSRNATINERVQAKRLRTRMEAEQARRREREATIARAHRNARGPSFDFVLEPQQRLRKPRIIKPGGLS
jgi:hypothetical protein